jgi:hypothetical protein
MAEDKLASNGGGGFSRVSVLKRKHEKLCKVFKLIWIATIVIAKT